MSRIFRKGLHRVGSTDRQRAVHYTDVAVSQMIHVRDKDEGCITCGAKDRQMDNGHFRRRENMSTRFHPLNCNLQCTKENRFEGGKTFEYGLALDKKYGKGCALFLEKLSRKIEHWTETELDQLKSAAKMGHQIYTQTYYELRPLHRFK